MTTITLTAYDEGSIGEAPAPFVDILVDDIDVGASFVTVWRTIRGRAMKVRGLVKVSAGSAVTTRDFEAGFGAEASYRVEHLDEDGLRISFSAAVAVTLSAPAAGVAWMHNPLDPSTAVRVEMIDTAAPEIVRATDSERFRIPGRSVSVAITGTRRGVEGIVLDCTTATFDDADRFDALFGGYDEDTTPILCVRTGPEMRLPPTLFALVGSPRQRPWDNWNGGEATDWLMVGDEVAPPAEAIITALLDYADFTAFYASYAAFTASYVDYTEASRDYSIAGTG